MNCYCVLLIFEIATKKKHNKFLYEGKKNKKHIFFPSDFLSCSALSLFFCVTSFFWLLSAFLCHE